MREALGSWLSGPANISEEAIQATYRGENLGLPPVGSSSVASNGRRVLSLCIDWLACMGLSLVLWGKTSALGTETLFMWWLVCILSVWLMNRTPGQLLCGIYVTTLNLQVISADTVKGNILHRINGTVQNARGVGLVKAAIRQTLLLPFLIPAFSQDENGRGLHDRATATIILCS